VFQKGMLPRRPGGKEKKGASVDGQKGLPGRPCKAGGGHGRTKKTHTGEGEGGGVEPFGGGGYLEGRLEFKREHHTGICFGTAKKRNPCENRAANASFKNTSGSNKGRGCLLERREATSHHLQRPRKETISRLEIKVGEAPDLGGPGKNSSPRQRPRRLHQGRLGKSLLPLIIRKKEGGLESSEPKRGNGEKSRTGHQRGGSGRGELLPGRFRR